MMRLITFSSLLLFGLTLNAAEIIYLDETVISGNQELPRVLYVLPWKATRDQSVPTAMPPMNLSGLMTPIYPHEYRRELAYRNLLLELAHTNSAESKNTQLSEED